jgi:ATP-dependent Clp protease ATP-binding subunit ClpC
MFERFTDRARRVLVLAQEEARLLEHGFIGTEHILLGLIHEGDDLAAKALESLSVSLEAVRSKVEEILGEIPGGHSEAPPFTPRAKKVLELSLRESLQLGHGYIGTEHILLGLVREGEGVAATILVSLGADLGRVRQTVIELIGDTGGPITPSGREPGTRRVRGRAVARPEPESPGSNLLRRYVAGELSEEERADDAVTKAMAETLLHLEDLLRQMTRRFLPPDD